MAARFRFRLEKVLELKIQKENEHMITHSKILNKKIKIESDIDNLENTYNEYLKLQNNETDILNKKLTYNYTNFLYQSVLSLKEELKGIEVEYEESLSVLTGLQLERKALEKLKEKHYQKYIAQLDALEDDLNDEFATQAYFKNLKNN